MIHKYTRLMLIYRGKSIKLFVSGDYELLCKMYGISGASGSALSVDLTTGMFTS